MQPVWASTFSESSKERVAGEVEKQDHSLVKVEGSGRVPNLSKRIATITVLKPYDLDGMPSYIRVGHRHLEKEKGAGEKVGGMQEFTIPVDLVAMTLPPGMAEDIERVTFGYRPSVTSLVEL